MSDLSRFFKKNKETKVNVFYPATKSLKDEEGNSLDWELKHITTKENEGLQADCTIDIPIPGKPGQYRQKIKSFEYATKLAAASVVSPDLYNAELQDSYSVKTPEALIQEMIDDSGEWNALLKFINELNGFTPLQEDVNEAKN